MAWQLVVGRFFAISHQSYEAGGGAWEWVLAGYQWLVTRYQWALMECTRQLNKDIIYEQGRGARGLQKEMGRYKVGSGVKDQEIDQKCFLGANQQ